MDQDKPNQQVAERKQKRNQTIKEHKASLNNIFSYLDLQVKSQGSNIGSHEKKVLIIYTGIA